MNNNLLAMSGERKVDEAEEVESADCFVYNGGKIETKKGVRYTHIRVEGTTLSHRPMRTASGVEDGWTVTSTGAPPPSSRVPSDVASPPPARLTSYALTMPSALPVPTRRVPAC